MKQVGRTAYQMRYIPAGAFALVEASGRPEFSKIVSVVPDDGFSWSSPAAPFTATLENGQAIKGIGHTFIDCYFIEETEGR